jgi:hypothetical protein
MHIKTLRPRILLLAWRLHASVNTSAREEERNATAQLLLSATFRQNHTTRDGQTDDVCPRLTGVHLLQELCLLEQLIVSQLVSKLTFVTVYTKAHCWTIF